MRKASTRGKEEAEEIKSNARLTHRLTIQVYTIRARVREGG